MDRPYLSDICQELESPFAIVTQEGINSEATRRFQSFWAPEHY